MKYYIAEVSDVCSRREGITIEAKNLNGAKVLASRMQMFQGTTMIITRSLGKPILAFKENGKWENLQFHDFDLEE